MAASKLPSWNGSSSATARMTGAAPSGRSDHDVGRFHGDHVEVLGLMRARAGPGVHNRPRIPEHRASLRRNPRIRPPDGGIALADGVVQRRGQTP